MQTTTLAQRNALAMHVHHETPYNTKHAVQMRTKTTKGPPNSQKLDQKAKENDPPNLKLIIKTNNTRANEQSAFI